MRVFLSWAHDGDPEWTVEQRAHWRWTVVEFGLLLDRYVDVEADFFRAADPGVDWTRYGPKSIGDCDVVLIVGSASYWQRWEGSNPPDEGAGVAREADALHGLYDRDQRTFQEKVVIAILPGQDSRAIPHDLARVNAYRVDVDGSEPLLRRLLGIPEFRKNFRRLIP
jgi:hypothetical protein